MRLSRTVLPFVVGVLLTVAGVLFGGALFGAARDVAGRLDAMGAAGRLLYVGGYAVVTLAFVPGWIPTLAAGAVFSYAEASAVAFVGATLGSLLAFLTSRWFSRGEVERRIAGSAKLRALDDALAENGTFTVFLLRLSPLLPFNLLNYVLGATRVRTSQFLLGAFGKIPGRSSTSASGARSATSRTWRPGAGPARRSSGRCSGSASSRRWSSRGFSRGRPRGRSRDRLAAPRPDPRPAAAIPRRLRPGAAYESAAIASARTNASPSARSARSAATRAAGRSSEASAARACPRTTGSASSRARRARAGAAAVVPRFAATTAALRTRLARPAYRIAVAPKRARNDASSASASTSSTSSRGPAPASGRNSGHEVSAAKRLNGQTSWHTSHP